MFLRLLPAVGASVVSLWLAAFVAMPRQPLPHNEVQELVYARLLGRQALVTRGVRRPRRTPLSPCPLYAWNRRMG